MQAWQIGIQETISEFKKVSLSKPFCEKEFYFLENKKNVYFFHIDGFAFRITLKQRLEVTRKWPTELARES